MTTPDLLPLLRQLVQNVCELVAETVDLVEIHLPEVNTSTAHARRNRQIHRWGAGALAKALNKTTKMPPN